MDAAISDAKKKVKRKVEQCNKTYKFGGLEEFKKAVLVDVQRSYDDINRDLERELAQIYQKAENELTSECTTIHTCDPEYVYMHSYTCVCTHASACTLTCTLTHTHPHTRTHHTHIERFCLMCILFNNVSHITV